MYKVPFRRTKTDRAVSLRMTTLLTNFAKYGNPNGDPTSPLLDFVWDPVSAEFQQRHLIFSANPEQSDNLNSDTIKKFSPYYQKLSRYFCDDKFWSTGKSDTEKSESD